MAAGAEVSLKVGTGAPDPSWMGSMSRRRGGWSALAGSLAFLLGAAGVAAATSGSPTRSVEPTALAAALEGRVAVADQPTTTVAPPAPTTSTSHPTTSSTALKVVPTTRPTVPPVAAPATTRAPAPTTGSQYVYPSSWTTESNGISLTLRMEPATPHVGDTVTFTIDSSATVGTDYCCVVYLYVNGETVYSRFHGQGPCPLVPGPAVEKATYVATRAGTLGLQLQASRVKLCIAPPEFTTVNLPASTWVQPAVG